MVGVGEQLCRPCRSGVTVEDIVVVLSEYKVQPRVLSQMGWTQQGCLSDASSPVDGVVT